MNRYVQVTDARGRMIYIPWDLIPDLVASFQFLLAHQQAQRVVAREFLLQIEQIPIGATP